MFKKPKEEAILIKEAKEAGEQGKLLEYNYLKDKEDMCIFANGVVVGFGCAVGVGLVSAVVFSHINKR